MDLKYQAEKLLGKNRRASKLTQEKNRGQIRRLCDKIQSKYGLERLGSLKTNHIAGVIQDMKDAGKSPATLASYATAARTIAAAIGKQNIVPRTNREMGISRAGDRLKPVAANMPKIHEVTAQLYERAEYLGLAADLRQEFGLRSKESLLSHEVKDGALIVQGAKGGRPRSVPIRTEKQLALVNRVQDHIDQRGQTSLIPAGQNLKDTLKTQHNALEELGANKANNANAHACRHEYAQRLEKMGFSKQQIAEELGHGREDVVAHYVPS